jgi:putative peptide zinc metalloprotease protein
MVALAGAMEKSFYSPSWYRVAGLKPRLRSHARILRQHFRGQLWYVLQDPASGRFHRFTPAAYLLISMMNGTRTVRQIWELACDRVGDDVLTQEEMIQLLSQLHQVDVLHADVPPDIAEMSERATKVSRRKLTMSLINPLSLRLPLFDPDAFLTITLPLVRPLFSWIGAMLIVVVLGCALALAAVHWSELTANVFDRVVVWESLVLLIVTYPFVKVLHELGHAYAVKFWGGEVHELGVMFLVFLPVPYVESSSSAAFQEKWRRALVGAAGIIVELILASIALFVWLDVEEGLLRAFFYNVMLIGGVSTVLFNGNPLLRFDGYYVLADCLEIPNLADRAKRFINYLIIRDIFGVEGVTSPATSPGEPFWFLVYGVASFCYRIAIVWAIVLVVAGKFFVIGAVLAIWSVIVMVCVPLGKTIWFLFTSPVLARRRRRAIGVSAGLVTAVALIILLVPVPYRTVAEGIVWIPGEASVFARTEGTVVTLLCEPNSRVAPGDPLIKLEDPLLDAQVRVLEASVSELELRRISVAGKDPLQKQLFEEQLERAKGDLDLHRKRIADLVVRSPGDGRFVLRRPNELLGKFVHRGETLGFVASFDNPIVRLVVTEDALDLVRMRPESVEIRLVDKIDAIYFGFIQREVPNVSDRLPSLALGTPGGGDVMIDPRDLKNPKALSKLLHLDLGFRTTLSVSEMGGRVYARFDHGNEPLASRLYRDLRQLFLRRFNV